MKQLWLDVGGAFTWLLFLIVVGVQLYYVIKFQELFEIHSGHSLGWLLGFLVFLFVAGGSIAGYLK